MGRCQLMERICPYLVLLLSLLAIPGVSLAANHFVRAGATGLGNGSDWNNAFTALPATLIRSDTYYIADGSYSSYVFDDAASGTAVITIKKATIANHGTDIGWNNTFGDGQAVFSPDIEFKTSNWLIDGQTRTDRKSGHGFKINNSPAVARTLLLTGAVSNITLRYVEVAGDGSNSGNCFRQFYSIGGASDITIEYSYFHDSSNVHILSADMNGLVLRHNTFRLNHSDAGCHGESIADQGTDNVEIAYNHFEEIEGTGVIVVLNRGGPTISADNWRIYGNVFDNSDGVLTYGDGAITCINNEACNNWYIYNNTFVGNTNNSRISLAKSTGTNRQIYNNLWYNCTRADHSGAYTADYNYYILSTFNPGEEPNIQTSPTTNPFVDSAQKNFHLARATNAGLILSVPFNLDPEGIIRGSDGNWDRGAFEFGGTVTRPEPPTNLRVLP